VSLRRYAAILLLAAAAVVPAFAHEFRPGYLEIRQSGADTFDITWKVPARADGLRLALRLRLPETCVPETPPRGTFARDAYVERWTVRHPGGLIGETIAVEGLEMMATDVIFRVERLDGSVQTGRLVPSRPEVVLTAAPSALATAWTYFVLGGEHILIGFDHLLFVLALTLIVKGWRRLAGTITAFTLAHSLTLALATLQLVRVPIPPVEAVIALSIVFVAAEVVHGLQGREGVTARRPWLVALTFGLLHGLGFASALGEVGLPSGAIPLALFFFNLGVEAGQLLFILVLLIAVAPLRRLPATLPPWSRRVVPYAIGGMAMFWVIERVAGFALP
jgi:hypothetical protein